jgi:hypothetical protein
VASTTRLQRPCCFLLMLHPQEEREKLGLRGLLPAGIVPLSAQLDNLMEQLREKSSDIERYNYLATIQVRPTSYPPPPRAHQECNCPRAQRTLLVSVRVGVGESVLNFHCIRRMDMRIYSLLLSSITRLSACPLSTPPPSARRA